MKRGDIVTVTMQGDFGKPRPALVIQADALAGTKHVIICPMTSTLDDAPALRYPVEATPESGLRAEKQVMLNNVMTVDRGKCGRVIGELRPEQMTEIGERLTFVPGLAD